MLTTIHCLANMNEYSHNKRKKNKKVSFRIFDSKNLKIDFLINTSNRIVVQHTTLKMSSITTQIHSLAAEVKARFYQTMVRLHVQLTINKRNVIKKQ